MYLHKYDFHLAKLKWIFYPPSDRPGKLLTRWVKKMQAQKKISYMYTTNKEKVCDPQGKADLFAEYYQELYNNNNKTERSHPLSGEKIDSFLAEIFLPSLLPQQLECLNSPVTLQEVQKVICSSKLFKSPDPNRLPNEYYCTFVRASLLPCLPQLKCYKPQFLNHLTSKFWYQIIFQNVG